MLRFFSLSCSVWLSGTVSWSIWVLYHVLLSWFIFMGTEDSAWCRATSPRTPAAASLAAWSCEFRHTFPPSSSLPVQNSKVPLDVKFLILILHGNIKLLRKNHNVKPETLKKPTKMVLISLALLFLDAVSKAFPSCQVYNVCSKHFWWFATAGCNIYSGRTWTNLYACCR